MTPPAPAIAHPPFRLWALVPCAGTGSRAGGHGAKQYRDLAGRPLVAHTLAAFAGVARLSAALVVVAPDDDHFDRTGDATLPPGDRRFRVARCGGASRAASVAAGLAELRAHGAAEDDWVLVHDAARCLVTAAQVDTLIDACVDDAVGGLLAQPLADTLKRDGGDGRVAATVDRGDKWQAQTPQMFRLGLLAEALARSGDAVTDESSAIEALGLRPRLVPPGGPNFKVTWPEDFALAEAVLRSRDATFRTAASGGPSEIPQPEIPHMPDSDPVPSSSPSSSPPAEPAAPRLPFRIGEGWDVHALAAGRKLILGGVEIPHTVGLLGHSDADVLLHAITDALLGAAALGDIGTHFPDTDARYKGADSAVLLAEAARRVVAEGWRIGNIDSTVIAQAPKLMPHMPAIRQRIAGTLGLAVGQVNVKAKTAEKMGPVGEGRSMEARAVVLLLPALPG